MFLRSRNSPDRIGVCEVVLSGKCDYLEVYVRIYSLNRCFQVALPWDICAIVLIEKDM